MLKSFRLKEKRQYELNTADDENKGSNTVKMKPCKSSDV